MCFLLFIFRGKLKTPDKQKPAGGEENDRENQTSATLRDLRCFNLVIRSLNIYLIYLFLIYISVKSVPARHNLLLLLLAGVWTSAARLRWLTEKFSIWLANSHRRSKHCKNPSDKKLQRLQSHFQFEENTWMCVNLSEYASRLTGWLQRVDIPALFWIWRKETCRRPETAARWCRPPSRNYPTISPPIAEKQLTSA